MKEFSYVIKDELGMHVRPAGLLAKTVKGYNSEVNVSFGGRDANGKGLVALMGLGVRSGDEVLVTVTGEDEEVCAKELEEFFKNNL